MTGTPEKPAGATEPKGPRAAHGVGWTLAAAVCCIGLLRLGVWYDKSEERLLSYFEAEDSAIHSIAFHPEGKLLAVASSDGVAVWDIGKETCELSTDLPSISGSVVFTRDGRQMIVGTWDDGIKVVNASSGDVERVLDDHSDDVKCVALSPDGKTLASGSDDDTVRLWSTETWECTRALRVGHNVYSLAFSPDGSKVAVGESDAAIWSVESGERECGFRVSGSIMLSVAWHPEGRLLATGSYEGGIDLWDVPGKKHIEKLGSHSKKIRGLAFSPDGKLLVSGSDDERVRLWDMEEREGLLRLTWADEPVNAVAFSPDGKLVAAAGDEGRVWVWSVRACLREAILDPRSYRHW